MITAPSVRLDLETDRKSLEETISQLRPRLLILDPFVRLHRIDENASSDVAPLLAFLREVQRRHKTAVTLVHHSKKAAGNMRAGQALRGSSEFHAWGDSNLYMQRHESDLTLTVEHRAESAIPPLALELAQRGAATALEVRQQHPSPAPQPSSLEQRIRTVLADVSRPLPFAELRARCRVRNASLYHHLAVLMEAGCLIKTAEGYQLAQP